MMKGQKEGCYGAVHQKRVLLKRTKEWGRRSDMEPTLKMGKLCQLGGWGGGRSGRRYKARSRAVLLTGHGG